MRRVLVVLVGPAIALAGIVLLFSFLNPVSATPLHSLPSDDGLLAATPRLVKPPASRAESGPAAATEPAAARIMGAHHDLDKPEASLAPAAPDVTLEIQANYADDWIAGVTDPQDPGVTVVVTVTNNSGGLKAEANVTAETTGDFFVGCSDWLTGECPDIVPGDRVLVWADGLLDDIDPIGSIPITADEAENIVSGELHAPWFGGLLNVRCAVWEDPGSAPIDLPVDPDGGTFSCDFDDVGYDLQRGQMVAVSYYEPDGNEVINILQWPWVRANYAHDRVGANYNPGHTFWITVTNNLGDVKATATAISQYGSGWGDESGFDTQEWQWSPEQPDIIPSDIVHFVADNGYTNTLEVGTINGVLDMAADSISGTVMAPSFAVSLTVECHPWGAWNAGINDVPTKQSWAEPDGSVPFTCQWDPVTEWDIQPGQDLAVMYLEPDEDRVIDVYREPTAELTISKWSDGEPASGGNLLYHISYENNGDAPAENVLITDIMDGGIGYLSDTSGVPHSGASSGPIVWDVGTLDAGTGSEFAYFVEVTAAPGEIISNTAEISTSSYDQGEPWTKSATWVNDVFPNDTHLNIGLWPWTDDPAPGEDYWYMVNICNDGSTGSNEVTLELFLQDITPLQDWDAQHPGWYLVDSDPGYLALANPSIPSYTCSEVYVRVNLDGAVGPGQYLITEAMISAPNDLETEDNFAAWEGSAGEPRTNIWLDQGGPGGSFVPGGTLYYNINYGNNGNLSVGPVNITDTLPEGTTFSSAWFNDPFGGYEFVPVYLDADIVVWEIPNLDNGTEFNFNVNLAIEPDAVPGSELVNTAEITHLPGEERYDDNISQRSETLYDLGPNLRVAKYHNWNNEGQLGYSVHVENIGSEAIGNLWISDTLPAGTAWDGWWDLEWNWDRFDSFDHDSGVLTWQFHDFYPADEAWLYFNADLAEPGVPMRWYTNTVEVTVPIGDPTPEDNIAEDIAFSGAEVQRVEFWLNPYGDTNLWGEAVPGTTVTVTSPFGSHYYAWADPDCGGCWSIDSIGPLVPGDNVIVEAGAGVQPVVVTIPMVNVAVDTLADEVSGQIVPWSDRPVEVDGMWDGGYQEVMSDGAGNFLATYPDIPRGSEGSIRFADEIDYADVIFHRPFYALDLILNVNYGHDWVEGAYEPGHTIWITVTESDGSTVKGVAELTSDYIPWNDYNGFSTNQDGWLEDAPDLLPGDWVSGRVDNGYETQVQLGDIQILPNADLDVVAGQITAPWLTDPLPVHCAVWTDQDGSSIDLLIPPDPDFPYECDFGAIPWDLVPGQNIEVHYLDPAGNQVFNSYGWLSLRANIGPTSGGDRQVWGYNAGPNDTVTVTVSSDIGAFIAATTVQANQWGDFNTEQNLPEGSLAFWHWVDVQTSSGVTAAMQIYPLGGVADIDTDVVTVTAAGPPFFRVNLDYCEPDWCDWYDMGEIGQDGTLSVDLMAERGFDVRPGTNYQAELSVWDGHYLYYMWEIPAPDLGVWKWHTSGHTRPDGYLVYGIQYRNDGNSTAENVTIVDTLPPYTSHFDDTSGLPVTPGPGNTITWDLGSVDPGEDVRFAVTLHVDPGAPIGPEIIEPNCVSIHTSSEGDTNPDNDGQCTGPVDIWEDEVDLAVSKWAEPNDPTPGQEFDYIIDWCNNRGAAAGPVVMTDTLPAGVSLLAWSPSNESYWNEISYNGSELVLYAPALPGDRCDSVNLRVLLDEGVPMDMSLENLVVLAVPDDVNPEDNWMLDTSAHVSPPRHDLQVSKSLNSGVWTPGGYAGFSIDWHNDGNIATSVRITETMPPGMSYSQGWWAGYTPWPDDPLPDPTVIGNQLIWDFPELPVGAGHGINIELHIDESVSPTPELVNCASVAGAGPDDTPDNNESCVSLPVNPSGPNLQIDKWHNWNGDGQLEYRINFRNIGDEPVNDVWIVDTLPAGTHWNSWWDMNFDWSRFIGGIVESGGQLSWNFTDLQPGDWGQIDFQVDLDNPGEPTVWYTNTVEITIPAGDVDPGDNVYDDTAFSGGELSRVEFWLNSDGSSNIWGEAVPGVPVTVTTPYDQFFAWADPDCGGCWNIDDTGLIEPGDVVEVIAGSGIIPVVVTIPDPLVAEVDTAAGQVFGQIGGWFERLLEVHGGWDDGYQEIMSDSAGNFLAQYPHIPRGSEGYIRFVDEIDYAEIVFHRPFASLDLRLDVNYGHDWVQGHYEPGHTIWITVTESDGSTVKGVAELTSDYIPDWDDIGFATYIDGWMGDQPDLLPGDWVFGRVDNGYTSEVRIGQISGELDIDADTIAGSITADWYVDPLAASCAIWQQDGPYLEFMVDPDGGSYACDFSPTGWDLLPGQDVAVAYWEPDGDQVINVFKEPLIVQEIFLEQGWNMISSYVEHEDCHLNSILAPIHDDLLLLKNGGGDVYWPAMGIDDIGCWDPAQGYQIYMINGAVLPIAGNVIDPESWPIELDPGWSTIGYLRNSPLAIDQALVSMESQLLLAKNGFGEVYWPAYNIDQVGAMVPGQGYQVYLSDPAVLTYPANGAAP